MEELTPEQLFEKEYEDIMIANEQEQNEFEAFYTKNEDDYKRNVLGTIDNYCNGLDRVYNSDDRRLDDMLNKINRRING